MTVKQTFYLTEGNSSAVQNPVVHPQKSQMLCSARFLDYLYSCRSDRRGRLSTGTILSLLLKSFAVDPCQGGCGKDRTRLGDFPLIDGCII